MRNKGQMPVSVILPLLLWEANAAEPIDANPRNRVNNAGNPTSNHAKIAFTSRIDGIGMTGSHSQNHLFPVD